MFTNTYLPHVGGVARSVNNFATDLIKRGNRVLIVTPVFPDHEKVDKIQNNIIRVPAIQKFNGSDFSVRIPIPFFLDEAIDNFDPQVIHSHHPYLLGDAALRVVARRRKLPLVFTHHTLYEAYLHHLNVTSQTWKQFAINLSTQYANMCDRVIAPSQSIAELIFERGVKSPVDVIPTGVDTQFFATGDRDLFRHEYGIQDSDFVIGHLGRLAPEKNLQYLANAVSKAMKGRPDTVFLVVGEGPEKQKIQHLFKQQGLDGQLIMPGNVTGSTLANAYHAMDIFVFSSLTETQGMVLTEAMAAGLPVVALDASGVREVIEHGKNGLLLEHDTSFDEFARVLADILPEELEDDMKDGLTNSKKIDKWKIHTRSRACEFSRESSAEKLEGLYGSILSPYYDITSRSGGSLEPWRSFLLGLEAEWELMLEKAKTLVNTLQEKSTLERRGNKTDHGQK